MFKNNYVILLLLLGSLTLSAQESHVVLISIDGLRPDFYLDDAYPMPNIKKAMKEGAHANGVNGVFPSVTYPSHTSVITGVTPLKHGIYYNTPVETDSVTGRWNWEYDKIKAPTLFGLAREKGLKTASVFWPVSYKSVADYNIPEFWYLPEQKGGDRTMVKALKENASPGTYFDEVQREATGVISEADCDGDYYTIDDNIAKMSAYTIRQYKPAFIAIHLVTLDHAQHVHGREGDDVKIAVSVVDNAVRQILEGVEKGGIRENTTVIITGDHGFVDIHSSIAPNVLLAQAGLYQPGKEGKWKAYFHTAGASAFLHLEDRNDRATLDQVRHLLMQLPAAQRNLFEIKDRKELDRIGADPDAVLALAPRQGYSFSGSYKGDLIRPASGGTHGFYPDFNEIRTGFVAFGKGIRKGVVVPEMNLVDIAPLVAHLLDLPLKETDGMLLNGILEKQPEGQ